MSARSSLALSALLVAPAVNGQAACDCNQAWRWGNGRGPAGRGCEVRELTLPAGDALTVDANPNGSIRVTGERRRDVQVRAIVRAWARDQAEAERIASTINVRSDGVLRADGPSGQGRSGWAVSFTLVTPTEIDLSLETQNGSIAVTDVRGELAMRTHNGERKSVGEG